MKKQIYAALLLIGAICMASCEPPQAGGSSSNVTAISVNPKSVVLNDNEPSIRLAVALTPADAVDSIFWSSSDTTVAIVSKTGYVEAQNYGKCYIYAQVGELKDSCLVEVKSYLESLIFNGAIVWDYDTTYALNPETGVYTVDTLEASDGEEYLAYKSLATLLVFSDGFYINNSGSFDGTSIGTILELQAPMFYASAYLNNTDRGTIFCLGEWSVVEDVQKMLQAAPAVVNEAAYIAHMKNFIAAYNAEDDSYSQHLQLAATAITGPSLTTMEYLAPTPEQAGYYSSYIPDAICDAADLSLNNNFPASQYMCGLDYSIITYRPFSGLWGLNVNEDEATGILTLVDEKVHFGDPIVSTYGEKPAESAEAPALKPLQVPVISEDPVLAARVKEQLKNVNVIKLSKRF